MENIILSLLLLKSMTIYEMRTFIQKNLGFVCSDSLGSLQSAIKKLLEKEGHTIIQKGRTNIKYYVKDYEKVMFVLE